MGKKLDRLIAQARAGNRPTDDQVRAAAPTGKSAHESQAIRRDLMSGLVRLADAVEGGQNAKADDVEDDIRFALDPAAQRAAADELVEKLDRSAPTPNTQARHAAGQARVAAQAQIEELMDRAARGEDIDLADVKALHWREDATDAEVDGFSGRLLVAAEDIKARRGDLAQRDGREQRAEDASYAAARYTRALLDEGVVTGPGADNDSLPTDPRALADLIGRR